jgi:hypothetical protein
MKIIKTLKHIAQGELSKLTRYLAIRINVDSSIQKKSPSFQTFFDK